MDARVLEKFVRISGVYVHTGTRRSKQLVLTEELFTDGIVVKRCQCCKNDDRCKNDDCFSFIWFHSIC